MKTTYETDSYLYFIHRLHNISKETIKLIPDILSINYNSVLSKEWKNARILGEKCQLGNFCIESVPTSAKLILGIPNCSIEN